MRTGALLLGTLATAGVGLFALSGPREKKTRDGIVVVPGPPAEPVATRPAANLIADRRRAPEVAGEADVATGSAPSVIPADYAYWEGDGQPGVWATPAEFSEED